MSASLKSLRIEAGNLLQAGKAAEAAPVSDMELVEKVKRGDRQAFSELVRRHQRGLLRLVLRMTRELPLAEDIVQETFIKAYEKMDLFEGRSSFKSWLYQVGLNTAKNRFRSRSHEEFTTDLPQGGVESGIERSMQKGDVAKRLRTEIDQLPERQRVAITLRVFEDLSFKEIAQIMNCPYDTAKANYRHALLKLRETFEAELNMGGELENWNSLFSTDADAGWDSNQSAAQDHQEVEL
ncbi:MAG: sigma-70 family RNA polymerase sigma factor [Bdellovibrionaceae bacterium]|nr:sigma-70 family RNA polymerase sigma factor [Pseudobdellovibrionaceae bacterium]